MEALQIFKNLLFSFYLLLVSYICVFAGRIFKNNPHEHHIERGYKYSKAIMEFLNSVKNDDAVY